MHPSPRSSPASLVCVLLYAGSGCSEYQLGKGVDLGGTTALGDTASGPVDTAGDSGPAPEPAFGWYIIEDATQYPITPEGPPITARGPAQVAGRVTPTAAA